MTLFGPAALAERAEPNYDKATAQRGLAQGTDDAAMNPGELAK